MISSNDSVPPTTVVMTFSPRDLAYLMGVVALHHTLHNALCGNAPNAFVQHNVDALEILYEDYYSANEANTLAERLKAQLPNDSPVIVMDARFFGQSETDLVS